VTVEQSGYGDKDGLKELDPSPSTTLFSFISFHRIGFRLTVSPFPVLLPLPFPHRRPTFSRSFGVRVPLSPFLVRHAVVVSFFVSFGSSSRFGSRFRYVASLLPIVLHLHLALDFDVLRVRSLFPSSNYITYEQSLTIPFPEMRIDGRRLRVNIANQRTGGGGGGGYGGGGGGYGGGGCKWSIH